MDIARKLVSETELAQRSWSDGVGDSKACLDSGTLVGIQGWGRRSRKGEAFSTARSRGFERNRPAVVALLASELRKGGWGGTLCYGTGRGSMLCIATAHNPLGEISGATGAEMILNSWLARFPAWVTQWETVQAERVQQANGMGQGMM
ncbi:hypothetical protein BKA70DRAFT_1223051 [Coprinopsis sp. MPI-PUGE-AT-0042]|nr:hypothetical protein BKA70DRAFT_1223051 [Coprinopsis sp. MPI-PUGE-AT-0042]